jgi:hypothetical protein
LRLGVPDRLYAMNRGGATFLFALCALGALAVGCKQKPLCPALGSCGGTPPVGRWIVAPGHPSCEEDLYVPGTDIRLPMGAIPPTQSPPPEPALYDWCLKLSATAAMPAGGMPNFYYESGQYGDVSIKYEAYGHGSCTAAGGSNGGCFSAGTTKTGIFTIDYPAVCIREFGLMDLPGTVASTDPDASAPPVPATACNQLALPLKVSAIGEGSYRNLTCVPNPKDPQGCLCTFEVTETGGPGGFYQILPDQPNVILHINFQGFPERATFCHQGNHLQLTGADGDYLFAQRGLRTLDLTLACPVESAPGPTDPPAGPCDSEGLTCVYSAKSATGCTCTKQADGSLAWACVADTCQKACDKEVTCGAIGPDAVEQCKTACATQGMCGTLTPAQAKAAFELCLPMDCDPYVACSLAVCKAP